MDGKATDAVIAPRLKSLDEIKDKALMVHVGGDNMSINLNRWAVAVNAMPVV
ncbi:superoxide dismutase [Escherichia coli]|uniref:Superoxide dismutase n=1 Tax=Escherichia coli TaxID=562 RepID=A0A377BMM1_ECOLX|nr:superoxide dismutase [Escherichia coli]